MTNTEILTLLKRYVETSLLAGDDVAQNEELLISGMLDSLAVMSLVSFIEETFGISVPFDDVLIENFETLSAMTDYIAGRRAANG